MNKTIDNRTRFTLRLPKPLYNRICTEAERMGISTNSMFVKILWDWVIENADQPA